MFLKKEIAQANNQKDVSFAKYSRSGSRKKQRAPRRDTVHSLNQVYNTL